MRAHILTYGYVTKTGTHQSDSLDIAIEEATQFAKTLLPRAVKGYGAEVIVWLLDTGETVYNAQL